MAGRNSQRKPVTPLKLAIRQSGLTQQEIADEIGISGPALSRFVHGLHPGDDTRAALVRVLSRHIDFREITEAELWPDAQDLAA